MKLSPTNIITDLVPVAPSDLELMRGMSVPEFYSTRMNEDGTVIKNYAPVIEKLISDARMEAAVVDTSNPSELLKLRAVSKSLKAVSNRIDKQYGLTYARVLKDMPTKLDASRKEIRDTLEAEADDIEAALVAWEAENEKRKQLHADSIEAVAAYGSYPHTELARAEEALANMPDMPLCTRNYEEYQGQFEAVYNTARGQLSGTIALLKAQAEAERQRLENERIIREQREAQIARDAAEAERLRQEAKIEQARQEKADAERRARQAEEDRKEAAIRAEQARIEREAQVLADQKAAEARAEQRRLDEIARVESEKAAAIARAEREKQEAITNERRRAEQERQAKEETRLRQEAAERAKGETEAHKKRVHGKILAALKAAGLPDECAIAAGKAIVSGLIPNVEVKY